MTFIVAGDSYSLSLPQQYNGVCESWAWTLCSTFGGQAISANGWSNVDINRRTQHIHEFTPIIVNLSHPTRVPRAYRQDEDESSHHPNQMWQLNLDAYERMKSRFKRVWFWTPFPGYETFEDVTTLYLKGENDLWEEDPYYPRPVLDGISREWVSWSEKTGYTASHLTKQGHERMIEEASKRLKEWNIIS
jgi:hypothetical protein